MSFSLARLGVNQSVFVNLLSIIIVIVGVMTLFDLNLDIYPNANFDQVVITTVYPGATPSDVERLITTPIEKELKEVDGIKEVNSASSSNTSTIIVKIDPDAPKKQKVVTEIENAVKKVKDLPDGIRGDPAVVEAKARMIPVIEVSLSGEMPESRLQDYADALEDKLEYVDGVARVEKSGYRDREVQVIVDPVKMRELYVSFEEIQSALAQHNVNIPAGKIDTEEREYRVRTTGEFTSVEEVADVIIRANDAGNWLKVRDVAEVRDSFKEEDKIEKTWGTRSINLIVIKKESAGAVQVVEEVKKVSGDFLEKHPGDLRISYVNDYAFYLLRRLNVLKSNGILALFLVVGCMMLFLQWRVALMTVIGIPIAFFFTFVAMEAFGITLNVLSIFALIVVLGMLVDDGIIVAENVYRYMEEGMPPKLAAVKGTDEIMGAVIAAVFTTILAFAPLFFIKGLIGNFIKDIPVVVIIALLASLAEALVILPGHIADFVRIKYNGNGRPLDMDRKLRWYDGFLERYTRVVGFALRKKYYVLLSVVLAFLLSLFLAFNVIKIILFPPEGLNFFFIKAEAPIGTSLQRTNELIAPVEKMVMELPEEEVEAFVTTVGQTAEHRVDPFRRDASNIVQVSVYLVPDQDRKRSVKQIIADLRKKIKDVQGFDEIRFDMPDPGPPIGKAVEAKISGEDYEVLDSVAKDYIKELKGIDGTTDVTWDHKPGKEEIRVKVDHDKAAAAGVSVEQVAATIRGVFEGLVATTIKPVKAEEETDVTIMFPDEETHDLEVFKDVEIRNRAGKLIPLQKIADIEKVPGTITLRHFDGERAVMSSSNVDTGKITSWEVNSILARRFRDIGKKNPGVKVTYAGEMGETEDSLKSLGKAFLYAFCIVYLLLAFIFKSAIQPLVVMLAVPFGLIGATIALFLHGMPLTFMAILGFVGLNGIVVNDSIVLVDFINKLRASGKKRMHSIIKACQLRVRPIILTTVTTIGGLSTVAYGIMGDDPLIRPMAIVICWGLGFSTVLTLIVTPCIYSIMDDLELRLKGEKAQEG